MPAPDDVDVLALDYDRTLSGPDLRPSAAALDALAEARGEGLLAVVVSGRDAAFLADALGDAVDLVVAENGAILADPATGEETPLFDVWDAQAVGALGVPMEVACASANCDARYAEAVARAVHEAGLRVRLERNLDRLMVLPEGVDKAAGFVQALARLGVRPARSGAIGDGENDVALLGAAAYRVAVANAVPELKAIAHEVTSRPMGEGVAEWLRESWLPRRAKRSPGRARPG